VSGPDPGDPTYVRWLKNRSFIRQALAAESTLTTGLLAWSEPMTLATALHKLAAAGRIKSPWLPGMFVAVPPSLVFRKPGLGRIVAADDTTVSACRDERTVSEYLPEQVGAPDLTDPATLGCLLALVREASGWATWVVPVDLTEWVVNRRSGNTVVYNVATGDSEGAALAAALIALAEGT